MKSQGLIHNVSYRLQYGILDEAALGNVVLNAHPHWCLQSKH